MDYSDDVNKPSHYCLKYECIDVMEAVFGELAVKHFCLLNAFKYLFRCPRKNSCVKDIKKAIWYLNKYVSLEERKNDGNRISETSNENM